MNTMSAQPVLHEMGLEPKILEKVNLGIPVGYAFHMDALKYADYLRDFSTAREKLPPHDVWLKKTADMPDYST